MAIHTEPGLQGPFTNKKLNGWLALSPLLVFMAVYVAGSVLAGDFYKVPVAAAFIIATAYAMIITRGVRKTDEKIAIFSAGAGNRYGHPAEETLESLDAQGAEIYITFEGGCISYLLEDGTTVVYNDIR